MKKLLMIGMSLLCLGVSHGFVAHAHEGAHTSTQGSYGHNAGNHHSGQPAIKLFSQRYHSGKILPVRGEAPRLDRFRFNDRTRSLKVSGNWEVCEHANFLGRCVIVSYDVDDLDVFGLSNEITAVRPVYDAGHVPHGFVFLRDRSGRIHEIGNYYANQGYPQSHYSRYDQYRWHPLHIKLFASYGHYHPNLGFGAYGFRHPRYRKYTYDTYAPHYTRRGNAHRNIGHRGQQNRGRGDVYINTARVNPRRPNLYESAPRRGDATIFENGSGRGRSIGVNNNIRDLSRYGMNDRASSIKIKSGTWEVCEHANFRGRCKIIDASLGSFNQIGMNDNVTSIRRVREGRPSERDYLVKDRDVRDSARHFRNDQDTGLRVDANRRQSIPGRDREQRADRNIGNDNGGERNRRGRREGGADDSSNSAQRVNAQGSGRQAQPANSQAQRNTRRQRVSSGTNNNAAGPVSTSRRGRDQSGGFQRSDSSAQPERAQTPRSTRDNNQSRRGLRRLDRSPKQEIR